MRTAHRCLVALAAAFAFATSAQAQQHATQGSVIEATYQPVPVFVGTAAAFAAPMVPSTLDSVLHTPSVFALQERASRDVALMLVGGAGLVVGSLVDGDAGTVIMIGSGTVAIIGLYRYLT